MAHRYDLPILMNKQKTGNAKHISSPSTLDLHQWRGVIQDYRLGSMGTSDKPMESREGNLGPGEPQIGSAAKERGAGGRIDG